jgi:DNA-binding NarL/FixJ family response regulator
MGHGSATGKLGIMLVEDHCTFRGALHFVLNHEPDFEVVAQAGSLAEAREVLGRRRLDGRIDVAVVDLGLPDGNGTELIDELRRWSPGVKVVVMSAMVGGGNAEGVLVAGADAVLEKVRSYSTIAEELRRLADQA